MLEAKYASHMNGFRRKINAEVDKLEDVRNLLRGLLMHKDKPWEMDLDRPPDVENRLLNTGIIARVGPSSVRFTIFRSCLDAVTPRRKSISTKREDPQDPIDLPCRAPTGPDYGTKSTGLPKTSST
jgi:hypothetical protein